MAQLKSHLQATYAWYHLPISLTEFALTRFGATATFLLALFLPLAAVFYISAEAVNPEGTDKLILTMGDALKVLPIAAQHPGQLYVSGSLTLLALGALAVSYAAIATMVRGRSAAVATVAALLGGIGAFCGARWPARPATGTRRCR